MSKFKGEFERIERKLTKAEALIKDSQSVIIAITPTKEWMEQLRLKVKGVFDELIGCYQILGAKEFERGLNECFSKNNIMKK